MTFFVTDTLTKEVHVSFNVDDALEDILYVLDGEELSDLQEEDRDALLLQVGEPGFEYAHEPNLGLEVRRYYG